MTPFRFRLQRLLELRELQEQQTAVRLSRARESAAEKREVHDELAAARDKGRDRILEAAASAGELQSLGILLERLDVHVEAAAGELVKAEKVVDGVAVDLRVALQARRILDRLRDRRKEEWQAEGVAIDRAQMDDIALTRYHNRPSEAHSPDES